MVFCLIFIPYGYYDEAEILLYEKPSICPKGVDVTQRGVRMFSHIMVGANDVEKLKVFYDAVLGELGHKTGLIAPKGRCFYYFREQLYF
mgnify:CR=1 FL=1|tara:strand:+ start:80 stop:346 length:267 start_codon:yes stop_codon:yes gene_type:complete